MTDMGMNKLQQRRYLSVLMPAVRDVVTGRGSRLLSNPPPSSSPSLSHPVGLGAPGSATVPGFEVGTAEDDVDSSFSTAPREALTPGQSPGLSPNRAAMLALMHGSQPTGVLPRTLQFRSPQMHGTPAAGDTSAPPAVPPPLDTHPSLGNPPPPAVPQGATKPLSPAKARTRHLRVQTGAADAGDAGDGGDAAQPTLPDPEIMHRADDGHGNSDGAGGDRDGDGNGDDAGNDDDGGGDGDVSVAGSSESSDPLAAVDMALRVGDDMPPLLSSAFGTAQATVADTANAVAVATASGSPLLVSVPKWKEVEAPDGYLYYYNTDTNKTQWEVPDADYYSVDGKLVRSKDAVRSLLPDMDTVNKRAQELDASAVTTSPYLSQHRSPKAHARAAANRGTAASGSTGGYLAAHIKDASGQQGKATTPARKRTKAGARGTRGKRGTRGTRGASRGSAARGTPTDERSRGATARGKKVKSGGRGANRRRGARAKSPSATGAGGEEPSRWRSTWQQVMGHGGGGGGGGGGGSGKAKKKAGGRRHSSPRQPPGVAASAAAPVVSVAVPSRAAPRLPTRVAPTVLKGGYSGSSPVVPSTPSPHASPRAPKSVRASRWCCWCVFVCYVEGGVTRVSIPSSPLFSFGPTACGMTCTNQQMLGQWKPRDRCALVHQGCCCCCLVLCSSQTALFFSLTGIQAVTSRASCNGPTKKRFQSVDFFKQAQI